MSDRPALADLEAAISRLRSRKPAYRFLIASEVDHHHGRYRYRWDMLRGARAGQFQPAPARELAAYVESLGKPLLRALLSHEHADHWDAEHLRALRETNPGVPIYGPEGVARAAEGFDVRAVETGERVTAGPFRLRFVGGRHAVIHSSIPVVDNLGVLVNEAPTFRADSPCW